MRPVEISSKSRLTVTLLTLFLGMFGAHRFYMGKTITAVIMLLLSLLYLTTARLWGMIMVIPLGLAGLGAFIDLILAISGVMRDKEGRPIKSWR